jgi:hypothetical protein
MMAIIKVVVYPVVMVVGCVLVCVAALLGMAYCVFSLLFTLGERR